MRTAIVFVAMLLTTSVGSQSPDISARRLLSGWKAEDPSMRMLAEVIASAFASGLSWSASMGDKQRQQGPLRREADPDHPARDHPVPGAEP